MGPDDIDTRATALYGDVDWRQADGVLHVAAIQTPTDRIIAIGPAAPTSATDRFVLGLARARADVIVTTGGILRAEPDLRHRYAEADDEDAAFAAWRARTLARTAAPRVLVLSATGRFDADHPALAAGEGWIWTTRDGATTLGRPPAGFEVVVAADSGGTTRDALAHVVGAARGPADASGTTIVLEAGPTTISPLYETEGSPPLDELLLSRFAGVLEPAAEGPAFVDAAARDRRFGPARSAVQRDEASGPWTFERYRRAAADPVGEQPVE